DQTTRAAELWLFSPRHSGASAEAHSAKADEPGIQNGMLSVHLDSGSARFRSRPGMTRRSCLKIKSVTKVRPHAVMPGLDPGIHDESARQKNLRKPADVDRPHGLPG